MVAERGLAKSDYRSLTARNPFEAHSAAGADTLNIVRGQPAWNHDLARRLGFSLSGAVAHGFDYRSSLQATVPGIGTLAPSRPGNINWAEYGASISYRLGRAIVSVFGDGVVGNARVAGHETHGGIALRVAF